MVRAWPWVLLPVAAFSLLATSLLWNADPGRRPLVSTSTPTATERATPRPPGQTPQKPSAEPTEASDLAHRQTVLEHFACGDCHGVDRGWLMPTDHSSMAEEECRECHRPVPEPAPIAMHVTMEQAPAQEACGWCHGNVGEYSSPETDAAGLASNVTTEQWGCYSCHGGEADELLPNSHAGRSQATSTCIVCHETQPLSVPAVPHRIDGWRQCDFCHGEQRLTPLAGAHEGDVEDQCLLCHVVVQLPATTHREMLLLSHDEEGCTSCHAEGSLAPLPDSHLDRSEVLCTLCHTVASVEEPPGAPHSLTGRSACTSCHSPDVVGTLPSNHADRAEETCTSCHEEHPRGPPAIPHAMDNRNDCIDCHVPSSPPP